MLDNSKEGLLYHNRKSLLKSSFESISEKQEEMSMGSMQVNSINKKKNDNINSKGSIIRDVLDDVDIISRSKTQKNKKTWAELIKKNEPLDNKEEKEEKEFKELKEIKEVKEGKETKIRGSVLKNFKRKESKKKFIKRPTVQANRHMLSNFSLQQSSDRGPKKGGMGNKSPFIQNSIYTPESSFTRHLRESKSLTNSFLEMKFINQVNMKKTILNKESLNFNDRNKASIFEQIKNSVIYEKSKSYLLKIKICYGCLIFFSLISIILSISDVILYNNKSLEYLINGNNHTFIFNKTNFEDYYYINKRKMSSRENTIRTFNGIFSIMCVGIILIIYGIMNGTLGKGKKNSKRERFKRMLDQYYLKQRKKNMSTKYVFKEDKINEKIKVVDLRLKSDIDDKPKDEMDNANSKESIIIECILNLIFYPPFVNKCFVGKYHNVIFIYSLNSLFLIISLFKITNIYRAILYLSPLNNPFNKAICKSHLLDLNPYFMFKYNISKFPLTFLALNIILVVSSFCIVLTSVEFYSIDVNNDFWSDMIVNEMENIFTIFSTFFFFIAKNIHEEHCIKSILGKLILYFGGLTGMLICSYFIFYMNNNIELGPEEQDAFSKLTKLLNPINREDKAPNLIKSILFFKKIIIDNQNTEKDYRNKIEQMKRPTGQIRKPIFQGDNKFSFVFNTTSNNLMSNINETHVNTEKKKYIRYIQSLFFMRIKFELECKSFADIFKVARNSNLSLTDVLKTMGHKMDENITQLNNKIDVLIQNDNKYINFMKYITENIKTIKKIRFYHSSLLQYFVDVHNEYVKNMIELKKEMEINSPLLNYHSAKIPRKIKSNMYGPLYLKIKMAKSKKMGNSNNRKRKRKDMFDFNYTKFTLKKQRSSQLVTNYLQNTLKELKIAKSNQNTKATSKSRKTKSTRDLKTNDRTRSLDDWTFITNVLKDSLRPRNSTLRKSGKRSASIFDNNKK